MLSHTFGNPLLTTAGRFSLLSFSTPAGSRTRRLLRSQIRHVCVFLLLLTLLSAGAMIAVFYPAIAAGHTAMAETARNIGFGAGVLGFSLVLLTALYRTIAPLTAPLYAMTGGLFMTGLALGFEARYPGIAVQSIFLTLAVFSVMLLIYTTRMITVNQRFIAAVYAITTAIALAYLLSFLLLLLDISIPWLHGAGTGGILWYSFIVIIAALNLLIDFERIERLENRPHPHYMPWLVGLGLMVTLVWLYISILRLLARLRRS